MLLRRITKHVKDQNWFAVGIDFAIVVLGVFIGIQVANWNEARSASQSEIRLIDLLVNDLNGMRSSFLESDQIARQTHQGWMHAFRALEKCEFRPEHAEAIAFSFSRYQSSYGIHIQRSAFDEMQATGGFSRLGDLDLKNEIVALYAFLAYDADTNLGGRDNQLAAGRIMWKSIAFSYPTDSPYGDGSPTDDAMIGDATGSTIFNPTEHCDNLELRGAVWEMVDLNRDWLNVSALSVSRIDSVLARLNEVN